MSEPDWSDNDSVTREYCISDEGGYSNDEEHGANYVIDMDSEPSKPKAPATNQPTTKQPATKQPANKVSTSEPRKIIKKKTSNASLVKEPERKEPEKKELKADSKFEFNQETVEFFSKDILGDVKKICVANSAFKNDTALLCLLLKLGIIKEYKCVTKKCKIGKTWLDKPIQLLIHRKNGKMTDLTQGNLELMCPNCYIAKYGLDIFQKAIQQTTYTCKLCNYPLSGFSNSKKKERYCMACESRIMNCGYYDKRSEFITELKETIDNTSSLKKDEFTTSNYYNEVSQYKNFDSNNKSNSTKLAVSNKNRGNKTIDTAPIINLNMTVPDLDELINDF